MSESVGEPAGPFHILRDAQVRSPDPHALVARCDLKFDASGKPDVGNSYVGVKVNPLLRCKPLKSNANCDMA